MSVGLRYTLPLIRQYQHPWLRAVRDKLPEAANTEEENESFFTATLDRSVDEQLSLDTNTIPGTSVSATTMVNTEDDEITRGSDVDCISTMFRFASGSDAVVAAAGFIPEIDWVSNICRMPILEVCRSLSRSFEFLRDGNVHVRPGMREQAYQCAKALLHLPVQRLCVGAMEDTPVTAQKLDLLFGYRSREDHELESIPRVLDAAFNRNEGIPWEELVFSDAHYCWLSDILRCRVRVILRTSPTLPEDIRGFIQHSFSKEPQHPRQVIADCLLMVQMAIQRLPEFDEGMLLRDKRLAIYYSCIPPLTMTWRGDRGSYTKYLSKPRAGSRVSLLHKATACCEGFRTHCGPEARCSMHSELRTIPRGSGNSEIKRLALASCGVVIGRRSQVEWVPAICWRPNRPPDFLRRCFLDQEMGHVRDKPIEQLMFALGGAPENEISAGLARVDFSGPPFFNGLCRALRNGVPYRLRRATVAPLRHLDAQLFRANTTITREHATTLVSNWSSSAPESLHVSEHPLLVQASATTLLGFLNSPFWRTVIPDECWDILKYFNKIDDESVPSAAYRCFENPTVIPYVLELRKRGVVGAFTLWMAISWAKYPDLSEEVITLLKETSEGVAHSLSKSTVAFYASVMDGEMERIGRKLDSHHPWSFEKGIVKLRARRDALRLARQELGRIQRTAR